MTIPTERSVSAFLRRAGFRKATIHEDNSSGEVFVVRGGFSAHDAVDSVVVRHWVRGQGGRATPAQAALRDSKLRAMEHAMRGSFRVSGPAGARLIVRKSVSKPNARRGAAARSPVPSLSRQIAAARTPADFERARLALRQAERFAGLSQRDQFSLLGDLERRERAAARKPNASSSYDDAAYRSRRDLPSAATQFVDRFERNLLSSAPEDGEALRLSLNNGVRQFVLPDDVRAQLFDEVTAMERRQEINVPYWKGRKVQAHPATDAWMSGDTHGVVTGVKDDVVSVKMSISGKTRRFFRGDILPVA